MRLTNTIRDAFIRSVMDDVPFVKYDEQAWAIMKEDAIKSLPAVLQPVAKNSETSRYLATYYCRYESFNIQVFGDPRNSNVDRYNSRYSSALSADALRKLDEIHQKSKAQSASRSALENRLRGLVYGVTTRKALAEALPEFVKYLPPEIATPVNRSLPVVSGVIEEFKNAGWPKNTPQAQTANPRT